jgi:hypothetical protein
VNKTSCKIIGLLVLSFLLVTMYTVKPVMASRTLTAENTTLAATWCGKLSSYTTWYGSKPALFVWKGQNRGNPYAVSVYYNGSSVPNSASGVQTYSGPQIDLGNGWVGYYIAKRFYLYHSNWNDDWRWEVRGCLP